MTTRVPTRSAFVIIAGLSLLSSSGTEAEAAVYGGNPALSIVVQNIDDDLTVGDVELDTVRLHLCGGGVISWRPQITIDPVAGWSMDIPAGDHCEAEFVWATTMELDGNGFTLEYSETTTSIDLVGSTQSTSMTPFSVISGSFSGEDPELTVSIQ